MLASDDGKGDDEAERCDNHDHLSGDATYGWQTPTTNYLLPSNLLLTTTTATASNHNTPPNISTGDSEHSQANNCKQCWAKLVAIY